MTRALLASNSTNPGAGYLEHCGAELTELFAGSRRVAFIPYALADLDGYAEVAERRFGELGIDLRSVHRADPPTDGLDGAEGVFVGGGNTFRLLHRVRTLGLLDAIRRLWETGAPYAGASAGSNLACPTIKTTNDMPIIEPGGFDALGLVGFQINPHYIDGTPGYGGETREQRILEFCEENPTPVVALREGAMLMVDEVEIRLVGTAGGRLFRQGRETLELRPGTVIDPALVTDWSPSRPHAETKPYKI